MKRIGFSLIELLVVISVIAILAAIIFPVAARAKDAAYRSSDMSHLNELRSALQLYRVDQGGYPPALFYVTPYSTAPPANTVKAFLYPKRVSSLETFRPAYDRSSISQLTTAVWPQKEDVVQHPVGTDPQLDLDGSGGITSADDTACTRQAYGSNVEVTSDANNPGSSPLYFYKASGYDVAPVPDAGGTIHYEIHYALFWTGWGLGAGSCTPAGSVNDDPRQLGYNSPPDDTVITWNSFFRNYENHLPLREKRDIVLYLGGGAKVYDSRDVADRSWRLKP